MKNFLTVTMFSLGVPMILMGDEVRRTQHGNNNAYCHDDESTWFDWTLVEKHADVHRFVRLLIARRLLRDLDSEQRMSLDQLLREAPKAWHGTKLNQPDWNRWSHSVAFGAELRNEKRLLHLILNSYWEPLEFELPRVENASRNPWRRWIDTALDSPNDIVEWQAATPVQGEIYLAGPRSVVALVADA